MLGSELVRRLAGVLVFVLVAGGVLGLGRVGSVVATEEVLWDVGDRDVFLGAGEGFLDIADAGGHRGNVEALASRGVLEGTECASGQFCPRKPIQRWVMAVWLVRAVEETEPAAAGTTRFADVEAGEWWSPYVERLADLGITRGCSAVPARFCPTESVTRQEMASFLVRAFQLDPQPGNKFADVAEGSSHLADINALSVAGITDGCATEEPARYCPHRETTRAQMATFLARALGVDTPATTRQGPFTAVAAGGTHSCAIKTDGKVVCWGENAKGQAEPPQGEFVAIEAGVWHTCGIGTDGRVRCWGSNGYGQTGAPGGEFAAVAAGREHSCGLHEDGSVTCWGRNQYGQTNAPQGRFTAIAAGGSHSCALSGNGAITCWGSDLDGESDPPPGEFSAIAAGSLYSCGVLTTGIVECWGQSEAKAFSPARRFTEVTTGERHSCGLRTNATVVCWGDNDYGQIDAPEGQFTAISNGSAHSCGLRTNGTVSCWGQNPSIQSGSPEGGFRAVTLGATHSCGLRADSTVSCWGDNDHGQIDAPEGQFTSVGAGAEHSCGLRTSSAVSCWGRNDDNEVTSPEGEFTAVTAGANHSCALGTDGTVSCWGRNWSGQTDAPDGKFTAITAGEEHSCALGTDGTVSCWGAYLDLQIDVPDGKFTAVAAGGFHSCGLRTDGTISCWGFWTRTISAPEGKFTAVAAGGFHSCGLRTDGTVSCWGLDEQGETSSPDGQFAAVVAGDNRSCGLARDHTLICWGGSVLAPTPAEVYFFIGRGRPNPDMCRPWGTSGHTAGFPLPNWAVPSIGTIRVAVLFVDFPDAQAEHSTHGEAELGLPYMEQYLETSSYRKLDIEPVPLHRWLRAEHNYAHYLQVSALGGLRVGSGIDQEAVRLADPHFDFTDIDAVMVVMPSSHFGGGTGTAEQVTTEEGNIRATTRVNNGPLSEPGEPKQWGSTGAHELAHNLGLADLYPYNVDPFQAPRSSRSRTWVYAKFGLMGLRIFFPASQNDPRLSYRVLFPNGQRETGYTQHLEALEMLAWSRWQLGWLSPAQTHCISELETETTLTISPAGSPSNEKVMIAIPTSDTEAIVVESRRRIGYDTGRDHQWPDGAKTTFPALAEEGVLVYTVNAALASGQLQMRIAGETGNGEVAAYPLLTQGQSITISGYTITVHTSTYYTDTITITKTGNIGS